jgi:hypothetical protein
MSDRRYKATSAGDLFYGVHDSQTGMTLNIAGCATELNTLAARIAALEADLASVTRERDEAVRRNRCYRCDPDPDKCEHGVPDGEWCEPCNRDYKEAAYRMAIFDDLSPEDTPNDVKGGGK